jgi:hypothetical protein
MRTSRRRRRCTLTERSSSFEGKPTSMESVYRRAPAMHRCTQRQIHHPSYALAHSSSFLYHLSVALSYLTSVASLNSSAEFASPLSASLFRGLVDLSHLRTKELDAVESALDFFTTPMAARNIASTRPAAVAQPSAESASSSAEATDAAIAEAAPSEKKLPSHELTRVLPQAEVNTFDIGTLRSVAAKFALPLRERIFLMQRCRICLPCRVLSSHPSLLRHCLLLLLSPRISSQRSSFAWVLRRSV